MGNTLAPRGSACKTIGLFAVTASLSNFLEGYSNSYPNTASDSFRTFINDSFTERSAVGVGLSEWAYTWFWSLLLNVWFIGYLLGTFFTPYLNDTYGRKMALLGANCISLCGTLVAMLAVWLRVAEVLVVARLAASIGSGLSFGSLILFLQETTPTYLRGTCSYLSEVSYIAIDVVGMAMGMDMMLGKNLLALIGAAAIPGVFAILMVIPLKESPKWLALTRGNRKAALESVLFYRGAKVDAEGLVDEMLKELEYRKVGLSLCGAFREVLRQPHLRKAMIIGILSLQLTVGIWPIIYLSTDLLEAHFQSASAQYASFAFITANFLASVVGMCMVERLGRRPMLISCGVVNTLSLSCYVIFDRLAYYVAGYYRYGCVFSLIGFGISYGVALGPIAFFITSELVPQQFRSLVQSLVFAINTLINFFFSSATLPLYRCMGVWALGPLFIAPSTLSLAYLLRNMPETRGHEIHEIVEQLINPPRSVLKKLEPASASGEEGAGRQYAADKSDAVLVRALEDNEGKPIRKQVAPSASNPCQYDNTNGAIAVGNGCAAAIEQKTGEKNPNVARLLEARKTTRLLTSFSLDFAGYTPEEGGGHTWRHQVIKALKH